MFFTWFTLTFSYGECAEHDFEEVISPVRRDVCTVYAFCPGCELSSLSCWLEMSNELPVRGVGVGAVEGAWETPFFPHSEVVDTFGGEFVERGVPRGGARDFRVDGYACGVG